MRSEGPSKHLGILLHSKLFLCHHVDYLCVQSLKMLRLVRTLTFVSSSIIDSLLLLYFTLELNWNMPRVFGITLQLLIPISWNTSSGSLQLYASHVFSLTILIIVLMHLSF